MNEPDISQLAFVLLFQINFWLIGFPLPFNFKILSYTIVDFSMLNIVVFKWFMFTVEWQIWVKKVYGETKQ
jgi:hypothetical protein